MFLFYLFNLQLFYMRNLDRMLIVELTGILFIAVKIFFYNKHLMASGLKLDIDMGGTPKGKFQVTSNY